MGTWGHRIFEDDFAVDVRADYLERLSSGAPGEAVTTEMIRTYGVMDTDEEPVFWLSLAATQLEYGRLDPSVKAQALRVIDSGAAMAAWNGDPDRRAVLEELRERLNGPQRKPKRAANAKVPRLVQGDVFCFPLDDGRLGFGRVLIPERKFGWYAFYLTSSERDGELSVEQIAGSPVAFVVTCNNAGFRDRRWRVIGRLPLESHLTRPILFFHQAAGSPSCLVFDMWDANQDGKEVPASECAGIDRWGAFSPPHVAARLKGLLAGEPDSWRLHSAPESHERK
ncbi:immunity 26/phosphotriesterase HocA family protein [Sorangium sp. So ce145]|uniref:immunity 26/phosphotriesterase HocA family protein n=1 Tax=Sorangium sp. So ce145 TaxID=3133285 RepID=UPI003F6071A4